MARTLKDAIIETLVKNAILDKFKQWRKDRNIMNFLSGYKTYIVAGVMIVLAGLSFVGIDIPGVAHLDPIATLTAALGLIFARGGSKTDAARALAVSNNVTLAPDKAITTAQAKTLIADNAPSK